MNNIEFEYRVIMPKSLNERDLHQLMEVEKTAFSNPYTIEQMKGTIEYDGCTTVVVEEDDVIHKQCAEQDIQNAEYECLTPVALDGIEEVAHQKDRFLFDDVAHDVCSADIDKAEREDHQRREHQDNVGRRCRNIVDGAVTEDTVQCGCDGIQVPREQDTVERGVQNVGGGKAFRTDVAGTCEQIENDREVAQQI